MSGESANGLGGKEPRRRSLSIRARLMVLALVAVAPLLVERVRLLQADRSERMGVAYQAALDLARQGVERQSEVADEARAFLKVLARTGAGALDSRDACGRFLTAGAADVPWIKGLTLVGASGRITCSTFANSIGIDVSDRDYIARAFATGDFVMSNYMVSRLSGEPTIVAALPMRLSDHSVAVLVAGIDLQWVGRLAASVTQKPGAMVVLIDGHGTVLMAEPANRTTLGRQLSDQPLTKAMLAQPEGTLITRGPDGVARIFGFLHLPGTDARLAIGLDASEVLGRLDHDTSVAYVQLAFMCALVLFGVWFGGERLIVLPIRSLARTAGRFGQGNLAERATSRVWVAEFAPLAAALDDMAQKLAVREEELRIANAHLEELASHDGLSGLANRRGFDATLAAEWQRAGRLERPLALLMIDVDHFKLFNDHHGHVEGDECLRQVGEVIGIAAAKGSYFAARYGGEEFALLLPGSDEDTALAAAERLRTTIEALAIAHGAAPRGHVTVSIGVAALRPAPGEDAEALIEAADAALYAAKRAGRNTVVAQRITTLLSLAS